MPLKFVTMTRNCVRAPATRMVAQGHEDQIFDSLFLLSVWHKKSIQQLFAQSFFAPWYTVELGGLIDFV